MFYMIYCKRYEFCNLISRAIQQNEKLFSCKLYNCLLRNFKTRKFLCLTNSQVIIFFVSAEDESLIPVLVKVNERKWSSALISKRANGKVITSTRTP